MAAALASLDQCCIVVDKQQLEHGTVQSLAERGTPLSTAYLDGFEEIALPDQNGAPPVTQPGSPYPFAMDLGPVRVAGWRKAKDGSQRPMLHSKVLVLGVTTYYEDDEMFAGDVLRFHPTVTWMGSANWTTAARRHIEFGVWSTDRDLVKHNYECLLRLLTFSEQRARLIQRGARVARDARVGGTEVGGSAVDRLQIHDVDDLVGGVVAAMCRSRRHNGMVLQAIGDGSAIRILQQGNVTQEATA